MRFRFLVAFIGFCLIATLFAWVNLAGETHEEVVTLTGSLSYAEAQKIIKDPDPTRKYQFSQSIVIATTYTWIPFYTVEDTLDVGTVYYNSISLQ